VRCYLHGDMRSTRAMPPAHGWFTLRTWLPPWFIPMAFSALPCQPRDSMHQSCSILLAGRTTKRDCS